MKKHAVTILLVVVAIGFSVWVYLDRNAVTVGERKRRENSVFPAWRREELTKIELKRDDETIVLERNAKTDSSWRMTSPRAERADHAAADRLMTTLEFAPVVRKVEDGAVLGLDKPRVAGSIAMGGLKLAFVLGGSAPRPEGASYFRLEGEPPIVVSRELTEALLASSDVYRDRTVVPYLSLELRRFEVKHPSGAFVLERLDDHAFTIAEAGVLARRDQLEKIWSALAEMRAEAFPKEADVDRLVATPVVTLTLTPKDAAKPPAEIVIGAACPGHPDDVVILRKAPTRAAACAPKGIVDAFQVPTAVFVDRRPFPMGADEMEELRLEWLSDPEGAPKAIEIARKGGGWHMREPEDKDLGEGENDAASELVSRIAAGQADSATRMGDALVEPVAKARIRFGGEKSRTLTVSLGKPEADGRVIARREHDGAKLVFSRAVARRLVPRKTSLRPRELLGETRRVTRVLLQCGAVQELVDKGEGLRLVTPAGYETDASITQLVDLLARRKIDGWVADAPTPDMGLDGDGCRVVLAFEDEKDPKTIRFGNLGADGLYGRVEGSSPFVFAATPLLEDLAGRWYVSRAALKTPEAEIKQVRVEKGAERATDPESLRAAAASLVADKVVALKSKDLGGAESLVVEVGTETKTKRIACGPEQKDARKGTRRCTVTGVDAVFEVREVSLAPFLGIKTSPVDAGADGGALARDGGPR